MINKIVGSAAEAVSEIHNGATVMIGGFGEAGSPIDRSWSKRPNRSKQQYG